MLRFKCKNVILLLVLLLLVICVNMTVVGAEMKTLLIGTSAPGGNWYTVGALLAQELIDLFPGVGVSSGPGGSFSNVVKVNDGKEMQLGFNNAMVQLMGFKGAEPFFEKPNTNIGFVGPVESMLWQMVVPKDSNIQSIKDLSDKRINPAKIGWSDRYFAENLFEAYGITFDSITKNGGVVHGLDFDDAAQMMKDGQLDCTMGMGAIMPFIIDLSFQPGIRFLPVEGPEVDKLLAEPKMAGWTKSVLKKGTYEGLEEDVPTVAITTTIICNADMSNEDVYKITKAIYESGFQGDVFEVYEQKGFPKACDILDVPKCANIPVHPGAKIYFDEMGITLPEN